MCSKNALEECCPHLTTTSFYGQVERLQSAGYPASVLASVAEGVLGRLRAEAQPCAESMTSRQKVAVIPYMHRLSHHLKKVAQRTDYTVVFSAPNKLLKLCRLSDPDVIRGKSCGTKYRTAYVECVEGVVYKIPVRCKRVYVGQTGRCLYDRLREHANKRTPKKRERWLSSPALLHVHPSSTKQVQ